MIHLGPFMVTWHGLLTAAGVVVSADAARPYAPPVGFFARPPRNRVSHAPARLNGRSPRIRVIAHPLVSRLRGVYNSHLAGWLSGV